MFEVKKFYDIAGHLIGLEVQDDSSLEGLKNLAPFEAQEGDTVFNLRQVEHLAEKEGTTLLVSEEEGLPTLTVGKTRGGKWYFTFAPFKGKPVSCIATSNEDISDAEFMVLNKKYEPFSINNIMMLLYALKTAAMNTLLIHASVVVKAGRGVVFLGKSGTGKSTHSRLWINNIPNTELLNDDNPIIRVLEDGTVWVYGSPWSGKTHCYKQAKAEVAGIVRLYQAPFNKIKKLSILESYTSVYAAISAYRGDKQMADGVHKTLEKLIESTSCFALECLPDSDAARLCFETVYG